MAIRKRKALWIPGVLVIGIFLWFGFARPSLEPLEARELLTNYYVAAVGNDAASGSITNPWRTIANGVNPRIANGTIHAGDTVHFNQTDTFQGPLLFLERGGVAGSPITIDRYCRVTTKCNNSQLPGIHAQIGTDAVPGSGNGIYVRNAGNLVFRHLHIYSDLNIGTGVQTRGNGIEFRVEQPNIKYKNLTIEDVDIHHFGSRASCITENTYCGVGIHFRSDWGNNTAASGFETIRISRAKLHNSTYGGVLTAHVYYVSDGLAHPYSHKDLRIDHMDAYDNMSFPGDGANGTGSGVWLLGVDGALLSRNRALRNGNPANINYSGGGFSATNSRNLVFRYNEAAFQDAVPGGDPNGFAFDQHVYNSIAEYNYSHENKGAGYMAGIGWMPTKIQSNNVFRYNISQNDSRQNDYGGILLEGSKQSSVQVYGNMIYMNTTQHVTGRAAIKFKDASPNPFTVRLRNNIIYTTGQVPLVWAENAAGASAVLFQGNDYYSPGGFKVRWGSTVYTSLPAFRAGVPGQEKFNGQDVGTQANPRLTSPGSGGSISNIDNLSAELTAYRLTRTSPTAVRAGGINLWIVPGFSWNPNNLPGVGTPTDFYGNAVAPGR